MSPYVIVRCGKTTVSDDEWRKTAVREHCSAPAWNEEMRFSHRGLDKSSILTCEVWHFDQSGPCDALIGQVDIALQNIPMVELEARQYPLDPAGTGSIHLVLFWEHLGPLKPLVSSLAHRRLRRPKPPLGASSSVSVSRSVSSGRDESLSPRATAKLEAVEAYEMALEQVGRALPGSFPVGLDGAYLLTAALKVTSVMFDGNVTFCELDRPPGARTGDPIGLRHGARGDLGVWREWRPFRDTEATVVGASVGKFDVDGDVRGLLSEGDEVRLDLVDASVGATPEALVVHDVSFLKASNRTTVVLQKRTRTPRAGSLVEKLVLVQRGEHPSPCGESTELVATGFVIDKLAGEDCFKVAGDATAWLPLSVPISVGPTALAEVKEAMLMRQSTFLRLDRRHGAKVGDQVHLVRHHHDPSFVHSGLAVANDTDTGHTMEIRGDARLLLEVGDSIQIARTPDKDRPWPPRGWEYE